MLVANLFNACRAGYWFRTGRAQDDLLNIRFGEVVFMSGVGVEDLVHLLERFTPVQIIISI